MWYDVYEGKADADTGDCGPAVSQCSEYLHLFNLGDKQMSWNIFKRIAQLEQQVKDLTDFNSDNSRWLKRLDSKLFIQAVESKAFSTPVDQAKETRRLYQREWRAKNKLSEDARKRKNAYARAYYARTKGAKK
jgi:hypothetical protein